MPRKARWSLLAALVAAAWLASPPTAPGADLRLLPADAEFVVVVDLKAVFRAEIVKGQPDALAEVHDALRTFAGVGSVEEALRGTGADVFRDATRITLACAREIGSVPALAIVEGEFAGVKLAEEIREVKTRDGTAFFVAKVGPSTLLLAPTKERIETAKEAKQTGVKRELAALLEAAGDRQAVAFAATGPALARRLEKVAVPRIETLVAFLKTLDNIGGGVALGRDVEIELAVGAAADDAAKKLGDSCAEGLRMLRTLARLNAEKDRRFRPVEQILAAASIAGRGPNVVVRGRVTLDQVEDVLRSFPPGKRQSN